MHFTNLFQTFVSIIQFFPAYNPQSNEVRAQIYLSGIELQHIHPRRKHRRGTVESTTPSTPKKVAKWWWNPKHTTRGPLPSPTLYHACGAFASERENQNKNKTPPSNHALREQRGMLSASRSRERRRGCIRDTARVQNLRSSSRWTRRRWWLVDILSMCVAVWLRRGGTRPNRERRRNMYKSAMRARDASDD